MQDKSGGLLRQGFGGAEHSPGNMASISVLEYRGKYGGFHGGCSACSVYPSRYPVFLLEVWSGHQLTPPSSDGVTQCTHAFGHGISSVVTPSLPQQPGAGRVRLYHMREPKEKKDTKHHHKWRPRTLCCSIPRVWVGEGGRHYNGWIMTLTSLPFLSRRNSKSPIPRGGESLSCPMSCPPRGVILAVLFSASLDQNTHVPRGG
ncbi:hypothetical protein B0T24DRAFT_623198 [Lasiosphaeria ovina]|uniref:Uncharacterized protein n=1 Tax=Lasiosphaeria ovina TaxID=92902 RepID=A0AAE0KC52_9PEZI|nr:hypothetical protein B0T24DRAFT_623198 [Lasiosphaeria ovina]